MRAGVVEQQAATLRPLRLNFAQVCYVCGTRWCESPECVAYHDATAWAVCESCDGFACGCYCYGGLVEVSPAHADLLAARPLPTRQDDDGDWRVSDHVEKTAIVRTPGTAGYWRW